MKLSEALAEETRRFSQKSDDAKFIALATPLINLAYLDVGKSWDWPQLLTSGSVLGIPVVTGICAITNSAQTLQIAGATTLYRGRFFRIVGGVNEYRIMYIDTSTPTPTLTLDQPIAEATTGAASFEIEKRFYTLPTEVRRIVGWDKNERQVIAVDNQGLRQNLPNRTSPFSDVPFKIHGIDDFTFDYSAGTISTATTDSTIVTGVNTAWLTNAQPGNIMNFSTQDYRIKRVDSDTRIVLYNKVAAQAPVNTPYTISIDSALTLRPLGAFSTQKVIRMTYIRSVFDLVHPDDRILLSNEAKLCVLDFAQAYIKESLGADGWQTVLLKAQARLESAQSYSRAVDPSFKQFAPLVPTGMGRR